VTSTSIALERDWAAVAAGRREAVGAPPPPLDEVARHIARSYATAVGATLREAMDARGEYAVADTLNSMAARA
jgi:hypothetical protein